MQKKNQPIFAGIPNCVLIMIKGLHANCIEIMPALMLILLLQQSLDDALRFHSLLRIILNYSFDLLLRLWHHFVNLTHGHL